MARKPTACSFRHTIKNAREEVNREIEQLTPPFEKNYFSLRSPPGDWNHYPLDSPFRWYAPQDFLRVYIYHVLERRLSENFLAYFTGFMIGTFGGGLAIYTLLRLQERGLLILTLLASLCITVALSARVAAHHWMREEWRYFECEAVREQLNTLRTLTDGTLLERKQRISIEQNEHHLSKMMEDLLTVISRRVGELQQEGSRRRRSSAPTPMQPPASGVSAYRVAAMHQDPTVSALLQMFDRISFETVEDAEEALATVQKQQEGVQSRCARLKESLTKIAQTVDQLERTRADARTSRVTVDEQVSLADQAIQTKLDEIDQELRELTSHVETIADLCHKQLAASYEKKHHPDHYSG